MLGLAFVNIPPSDFHEEVPQHAHHFRRASLNFLALPLQSTERERERERERGRDREREFRSEII